MIRDRENNTISLDQEKYLEDVLVKYNVQNIKPKKTPLPVGNKYEKNQTPVQDSERSGDFLYNRRIYQGIVGSLQFAVMGTRPDLAYATTTLAQFANNPSRKHMDAAKHVLAYVKLTKDLKLTYKNNSVGEIYGYVDSSWEDDKGNKRNLVLAFAIS